MHRIDVEYRNTIRGSSNMCYVSFANYIFLFVAEEEIDVVTIGGEKNTVIGNNQGNNKMAYTLPNNPTSLDRQEIQRTMESAIITTMITNRGNGGGIKTLPPVRKPPGSASFLTKGHFSETRGAKRGRRPFIRLAVSPYKRRHTNDSDSDMEPAEKRNLHNNMERQRRIDLRNAFEDLRVLVPDVCKKERAAKVVILREAASYCDRLGEESRNKKRQKEELRREQDQLRARVSYLRRNLASKHR